MKNSYFFQRLALRRNKSFLKFFGLLAVMLLTINGNAWGQFSIAASSTNYTQNFNTLTNGAWTNGATLTGWYAKTTATASITTYGANTGTTTTAGLYAFGAAGTNPLTDRALGYVPSNTYTGTSGAGKGYIGWRLKNNTGSAITSLIVNWTGEQWRKDNVIGQTLKLFYQTGVTITDLTAGSWTDCNSTFTSPQINQTAAAIDGNSTVNRVANISAIITVNIPAGEEIMLRWEDLNDSGNDHYMAIDDVTVNATTSLPSPTLTTASSPTVDAGFDVTFTEDASWRGAITEITIGGTTLAASAYDKTAPGKITFIPSASALLQSAGTKAIVVKATGYSDATVSQAIGAGVAAALTMKTQPTAPSTNGAVLATQPEVNVLDQYGNITTATVVASKGDAGAWTLGGTTSVAAVSGVSTFTNLTATSAAAVTGASLTFSSGALTVNSATFDIAAPPAQFEWANLQWPGSATFKLGESYEVYAQAYKSGVTDAAGQGANVKAWIGYSTTDDNPATGTGWTWIEATFNGDAGNNDEYVVDLGAAMSAIGTYYFASRFQLGTGLYVYGGFSSGFWDGTTNVSGVLTVKPAETLDWVNLQAPASGNITTAQTLDVYAQVYESGLTEAGGQGAGVSAWIGYSTSNTNPNTWTNWVPASFNVQSGNNDEYKAILSGLTAGTYYYASRFKYGLADYQYGGLTGAWVADQSGVLTVTTAEPADHVTNFAAATTAPTHSSIHLTWTDAVGASHYLIKGSAVSYEDITTPVDLSSEVDGTLVKNVAAGAGTYTFEGLTGETAYFFKIFPYNGTGAAVNFKTDGTVPQASATTAKTPTLLLVEDFDYTDGTDLTANNWNVTGSAATPTVKVTAASISYPGYLSSGIGNETLLSSAGGQDVNRTFTEQISGTVYASCLVNVTSATTGGDYFFHFGPSTMGTAFRGRVFVKNDGSGNLAFGIQHIGGTNNTNINYTTFSYALNTTYLMVLKYSIVSGTANDVAAIYINPVLNASEPITNWLINTDTPTDPANIGSIGLRQASSSTAPNVKLDGVRVSTKWSDIVGDLPTFTGTGEWTDAARWNTGAVPGTTAQVVVDGAATINSDVEVAGLTINATKTLTVNAGKQFSVTGTATNNGTIKLLSSEADGTATLVGDVGGSAEVHQSVTGFRTYYLGSPVSTVTALSGITGVSTFNVSTDKWVTPIVVTDLEAKINENGVGIGFLGQVLGTETTDISLTGTLNTGTKPVTLVTDATKKFNFLGNPYPSYLNAKLLVEGNSTVEQSIWYRTQTDASTYSFVTYNVPANITTPAPTSGNHGFIPPMQGFWVKASGTETGFSFTNAMRTHNTTAENIPLKAPQAAVNQILRLQVTNGTALDEAVVLFNENATTGYDSYDASKMMNTGTGVLNIYTVLGTENLVLNSQPTITYGVEIPMGMNLAAGTYTVSANEFSNFAEGTKAQLLDKATGTLTDLPAEDYTFTLTDALNSTSRFALVFPQNAPTGVDNAGAGDVTVFTRSNRIVVTANEAAQGSIIYVFNGVGQRLAAQAVSGTVNEIGRTFPAGVYVVKVNNVTAKVVVK